MMLLNAWTRLQAINITIVNCQVFIEGSPQKQLSTQPTTYPLSRDSSFRVTSSCVQYSGWDSKPDSGLEKPWCMMEEVKPSAYGNPCSKNKGRGKGRHANNTGSLSNMLVAPMWGGAWTLWLHEGRERGWVDTLAWLNACVVAQPILLLVLS